MYALYRGLEVVAGKDIASQMRSHSSQPSTPPPPIALQHSTRPHTSRSALIQEAWSQIKSNNGDDNGNNHDEIPWFGGGGIARRFRKRRRSRRAVHGQLRKRNGGEEFLCQVPRSLVRAL
mmetsp:Transcript_43133/g.90606  ORF Transcript_43133/g.90606 Transcript_43133/m.90606 type:complete len:120 (-) Transcript_43133:252-611(-)